MFWITQRFEDSPTKTHVPEQGDTQGPQYQTRVKPQHVQEVLRHMLIGAMIILQQTFSFVNADTITSPKSTDLHNPATLLTKSHFRGGSPTVSTKLSPAFHPNGPPPTNIPYAANHAATPFDHLIPAGPKDHGTTCAPPPPNPSYISTRCSSRIISACCPSGYQDDFSENCAQQPACKRDPGDGSRKRAWPGVSPEGAVHCGKDFDAWSRFYGACVESPVPESFVSGKCSGPGGNLWL